MKYPWIWAGFLVLLTVIIVMVVYFSVIGSQRDPGVTWKVPYKAYPELRDIYEAFKATCTIPELPKGYVETFRNSTEMQRMREDCRKLPDKNKYRAFELNNETERDQKVQTLFQTSQFPMSDPNSPYSVRGGCFIRQIPENVEMLASERIQSLMKRIGLENRMDRLTDSRGTTYMPPGGFMEYHSNQNHFGGWRLYMHFLPTANRNNEDDDNDETDTSFPDLHQSWFAYEHPFDGSYRRIYDQNDAANMFRIRKPPKKLLWHSIFSDTHRFSWGIWLPPELAQHLKTHGQRA